MKMIQNSVTAASAVMEYLALSQQEVYELTIRREQALYEIRFTTDYLAYDCYVDAESGEVLGVDFRPLSEEQFLGEVKRA